MFRGLVRSLRPHQWAKNLFVLAPLVFAHGLASPLLVGRGLAAFAAFCAASSAVYLLNDLRDRERDLHHPLKRHRPIAAGTVPASLAVGAAVVLLTVAAVTAATLGAAFALVLAGYLTMNLFYTLGLKDVVILDVLLISIGFVLRVLGGGAAVGVEVSRWLLLCTIFLALFLAFSKRRHEIALLDARASDQRLVLEQYSPAFLDQMINVVTASAVVSYAMYAISPETTEKYDTQDLIWTIPLVLFGIFRYLFLVYQRPDRKNPTEALLTDLPFVVNLLMWGAAVVWIVYG
ncbi:MAG TPA: decaprenyl-phosphate phosphoribosyltransferase [Thermoanaerobaculia bacterium]|nr:decaprenyl-phosphate phosphoribosyltransferase [Thermoanaerobaculia bacterium]